jgi:hypothetical protein
VALIQDLNIASIHCAVTIGNSLDGSVAKIHLPQKILGQGSFHFRYRMWSKYFLQQSPMKSSEGLVLNTDLILLANFLPRRLQARLSRWLLWRFQFGRNSNGAVGLLDNILQKGFNEHSY